MSTTIDAKDFNTISNDCNDSLCKTCDDFTAPDTNTRNVLSGELLDSHPLRSTPDRSPRKRNRSQMLPNWSDSPLWVCNGNIWPDHWSSQQKATAETRSKALPEEFYTATKLPIVTPGNVIAFLKAHKRLGIAWQFQEQWSGSGRLSKTAYRQGLSTLFPIDSRYGWDIQYKKHRDLIDLVRDTLTPLFKWSGPDCRRWSSATNAQDPKTLEQSRQEEFPALSWLVSDCKCQHFAGRGYGVENGLRSQIWTRSPLQRLHSEADGRTNRSDACQFGLVSDSNDPIQKSYRFETDIPLRSARKSCHGHGVREHQKLEGGKDTAKSAVYTPRLCACIIQDVCTFLRKLAPSSSLKRISYEAPYAQCGASDELSDLLCRKVYSNTLAPQNTSDGFVFEAPVSFELHPGEWTSIHTGWEWNSTNAYLAAASSLMPACELLPGLSCDDHLAVELGGNRPHHCLSVVVRNCSRSFLHVPAGSPVLKLCLWSCPKCKHGGEREHSRLPGKCKLAPKGATPTVPPKPDDSPGTADDVSSSVRPAPDDSPGPVGDPQPLEHQVPESHLAPPEVPPLPPPAQAAAPPPVRKPVVVKDSASLRIRDAYQKLKGIKVSDVVFLCHEEFRNLDQTWLKRLLVGTVVECKAEATASLGTSLPVLLDRDTLGVVMLLKDLLAPHIAAQSILVTHKPSHLAVAEEIDLLSSPFRITFIGLQLDCWECSGMERLDSLTPENRYAPIRDKEWMITVQGHTPLPSKLEDRMLPRLKQGLQPPSFDFSSLRQDLLDSDTEGRVRLLKGLHEKLWHEMKPGMTRFLSRLGVPDECYKLIDVVLQQCPHCLAFQPPPRRPRFGASLAGHFNDVLMVDLFYIFQGMFLLLIDEATRFKVVAPLAGRSAKTLAKAMLYCWFRYFGVPRRLVSDQEGGIKSEEFAAVCDRYSIHRQLAGSDAKGEHTTTGLPEKHIDLIKIASLKTQHQCAREGLLVLIDAEDIVVEVCMNQNHVLEYGGFTPSQALLGHNPRGLYETETSSVLAHAGAAESSADFFEQYLRMRLIAKACIQQAIIEHRLALANKSAPQKVDLKKLIPLETTVDLWRMPEVKGNSGWRGPCELLDISRAGNSAIVKHQSVPYIVPLRHIRPHVAALLALLLFGTPSDSLGIARTPDELSGDACAFAAQRWRDDVHADIRRSLHALLDFVDSARPGKAFFIGSYLTAEGARKCQPAEFEHSPPDAFVQAGMVASQLLSVPTVHAIVYGTGCARAHCPVRLGPVTALSWLRADRTEYSLRNLHLTQDVRVNDLLDFDGAHRLPEKYSWLLLLGHDWEQESPGQYRVPDLSDISMIEENSGGNGQPPDDGAQPPDSDWWMPSILEDMYPPDNPQPPDDSPGPSDDLPGPPPLLPPDGAPHILDHSMPENTNTSSSSDDRSRSDHRPPPAPGGAPAEITIDDVSLPQADPTTSLDESMVAPPYIPPPDEPPEQPISIPQIFQPLQHTLEQYPDEMSGQSQYDITGDVVEITGDLAEATGELEYSSDHTVDQEQHQGCNLPLDMMPDADPPGNLDSTLPDDPPGQIAGSSGDQPLLPTPDAVPPTLDHTAPVAEDEPPTKKHKDNGEDEDYYSSFFFSCESDIHTKDAALLCHMEKQAQLIHEGLEEFKSSTKAFLQTFSSTHSWTKQEANAHFVFPGPWKEDTCFYVDLNTLEAFRVDKETDNLSEAQVHEHWDLVEAADRKEIQQFVDCGIWKSKLASSMNLRPVDAIWVRKFKRMSDGTLMVKSRLCARGFLDSQVSQLATRATTATKLSQKLLLALSQIFGLTLESWDVSGAFLKGFPFKEIERRLKAKGHPAPVRQVSIRPPSNVWRHLREITNSTIKVSQYDSYWYVLDCIKAMYGLNDAPLAWQLALQEYLGTRGGIQSTFDECFYFWPDRPGSIEGVCTCHVDDNAVAGTSSWRETEYKSFAKQFGGASRDQLPFTHCGIHHQQTSVGLKQDQDAFCQKLQPFPLSKERSNKDDSALTPDELSGLRAVLGALLWLCQTRLDIICDVVLCQQEVTRSTIATIKAANSALTRAKKYAEHCGLVYPVLKPPFKLMTVGDSSHATRTSSYAQEGCLILLMSDKSLKIINSDSPQYKQILNSRSDMSDFCIVMAYVCHKAKRVSSSTSMAETLIANFGKELAQLVVMRLTEVLGHGIQTPFKQPASLRLLIEIQENAQWAIPVDQCTDCKDVFELVTGLKGVPQDRYQRVYVMSLREDRIKQAIRRFMWIPTTAMLADSLTKQMISAIMYDLLHFGYWQFDNRGLNPLVAMELQLSSRIDESEIVDIRNWPQSDESSDRVNVKERRPEWESPSCASYVRFPRLRLSLTRQ